MYLRIAQFNQIIRILLALSHYKDINNVDDFSKTRLDVLIIFWGKKVDRLIITIEYQALLVVEPFQH